MVRDSGYLTLVLLPALLLLTASLLAARDGVYALRFAQVRKNSLKLRANAVETVAKNISIDSPPGEILCKTVTAGRKRTICSSSGMESRRTPHLNLDQFFRGAAPCTEATPSLSYLGSYLPSLDSIVSAKTCSTPPPGNPSHLRGNLVTKKWKRVEKEAGVTGAVVIATLEASSSLLLVAGGDIFIDKLRTSKKERTHVTLVSLSGKVTVTSLFGLGEVEVISPRTKELKIKSTEHRYHHSILFRPLLLHSLNW